jgi:hypothetical protein
MDCWFRFSVDLDYLLLSTRHIMTSSRPLVLKHSAPWRAFPWLALAPLLVTGAILGFMLVRGTSWDEVQTPLLGMALLSGSLFAVLGIAGLLATARERAHIARVQREPWAVFPQFADEASWRVYADVELTRDLHYSRFPWSSVVVIIGAFVAIVGVVTTQVDDAPPELFIGVGAMLLIILGVVAAMSLGPRWAARRRYEARRGAPVPQAFVGKWGIYDEDQGFSNLYWLQRVDYDPPSVIAQGEAAQQTYMRDRFGDDLAEPLTPSGWSALHVTARSWMARPPYRRDVTTTVRIPPGREREALAILQRYQDERL